MAGNVPPDVRARVHMLGSDDLERVLAADAPAGVLVGFENDLESPLIAYAVQHNYRERQFDGGISLWVKS